MELYEIKEKVGSDPCLVLDFNFNATIGGSGNALMTAELKRFDTVEEAEVYTKDFVYTIEELIKTRSVNFLFKVHTEEQALAIMNNAVLSTSNLFFGENSNPNIERSLLIIIPLAFGVNNIKYLAISTGTGATPDGRYASEIIGNLSLT